FRGVRMRSPDAAQRVLHAVRRRSGVHARAVMGPGSAERRDRTMLRIARRTPHRVRDTKRLADAHSCFFGTTRNVALARAITASSAFTKHCAKQIVLPVLI